MIPKIEAVLQTLSAGVQTVQVLDGRRPHALRDAMLPGRAPGTTITNRQEALCQTA
jgi:acetylglutamate kinase